VGEQQNIVDAIYHTLVEQGKQLSKRANLYTQFCVWGPGRRWSCQNCFLNVN